MTAPTTVVRITHSWCPTCQGAQHGKARCGKPRSGGAWPAKTPEQPCVVCAELAWMFCERCGSEDR